MSDLAPGLGLVAAAVVVSLSAAAWSGVASPLVVAVVLGAAVANVARVPAACGPGISLAAKQLLRAGVVLLGFRLALGDVLRLGGPALAMVVVVVALTFFATNWLGRRMGLSPGLALLTATGFAICGASAVAAMRSVVDAEEEEVAFAIALVTLCGSLAIVVLPVVGLALGLSTQAFGQWVGASVHDVAQVVATAATFGGTALESAVVVKLTRVALLAPLVAGVGLAQRRGAASGSNAVRPALAPPFVIAFLAAAALRSTGLMPAPVLAVIRDIETLLFTAALFALGAGVHIAGLRRVGGRALALGLLSWAMIALVSYAGVLLVA